MFPGVLWRLNVPQAAADRISATHESDALRNGSRRGQGDFGTVNSRSRTGSRLSRSNRPPAVLACGQVSIRLIGRTHIPVSLRFLRLRFHFVQGVADVSAYSQNCDCDGNKFRAEASCPTSGIQTRPLLEMDADAVHKPVPDHPHEGSGLLIQHSFNSSSFMGRIRCTELARSSAASI